MYFEQRVKGKMRENLQGKKKLLNLWKSQEGRSLIMMNGWSENNIV
jgi:hypothetical protein